MSALAVWCGGWVKIVVLPPIINHFLSSGNENRSSMEILSEERQNFTSVSGTPGYIIKSEGGEFIQFLATV